MKIFLKRLFIVVLAIIAAAIVAGAIYVSHVNSIERPLTRYTLRVEHGDTIQDIAQELKDHNIIVFRTQFYIENLIYKNNVLIIPGAYKLSSDMTVKQIVYALREKPWAIYATIPPNASKEEIGKIIGKALGWSDLDLKYFANTFAGMQWLRYSDNIRKEFSSQYSWTKTEEETFLILSALYYDKEHDFFKNIYVPGTYEITTGSSRAQVAGLLIDQFSKQYGALEYTMLLKFLDGPAMDKVDKLIQDQMELLPDIVAIAPHDLTLKKVDGQTYLLFTASYWNDGRGPLELVADPATKGMKDDIERKVFQRIYRLDGEYRERLAGIFLWHQEHLHYHFADFATYRLESVATSSGNLANMQSLKATFCVRDSEPIDLKHPGADHDASYTVCGKERQGISPGWADTYYYTYPDQRFDVSDLPAGNYRLSFIVNPKDRFEEMTKDNDVASVMLSLDVQNGTVEVVKETKP